MGLFSKERSLRKRLQAVRLHMLDLAESAETCAEGLAGLQAADLASDLIADQDADPALVEQYERATRAGLTSAGGGMELPGTVFDGSTTPIETSPPRQALAVGADALRKVARLKG